MLSKRPVERKILRIFGRKEVSSVFRSYKVGLLHRVQPENLQILYKIQRAINLTGECDLVTPQFGIKLLITDALPEECTSVWGNK